MADINYKPNSFKSKDEHDKNNKVVEEKKIQKVVTGPVTVKKKTGLQKITETFISEDLPKIKHYVISDVIIPSVKKAISDIVRNGIDIALYGDTRNRNSNISASKVSYGSYYASSANQNNYKPVSRSTYSYDDIVLQDKGEAEIVLMRMDELIAKYGIVTVGDLYELVGKSGNNTDYNYGWTDLHSARTERVFEGYLLKLPRAIPIER